MRTFLAWLFAPVLAASGCADRADARVELGVIELGSSTLMIEAPGTVLAGTPFSVRITTYGGGCTVRERTDVVAAADGISITPYNRTSIPDDDEGCPLLLVSILHEVVVAMDTPGAAQIHVHGRRQDPPRDDVVEIALPIDVQ